MKAKTGGLLCSNLTNKAVPLFFVRQPYPNSYCPINNTLLFSYHSQLLVQNKTYIQIGSAGNNRKNTF